MEFDYRNFLLEKLPVFPMVSWEALEHIRENKSSYVTDSNAIQKTRLLENMMTNIEFDCYSTVLEHPLDLFDVFLMMGKPVPTELMILMAKCYEAYCIGDGELSMDEIFIGRLSAFKGPKHKQLYSEFYALVNTGTTSNEKPQAIAAEKYLQNRIEKARSRMESMSVAPELMEQVLIGASYAIDVDTFLRGYRRWKANKT